MGKDSSYGGFSDAERAAMKARAEEIKSSGGKKKGEEAQALLDAIAALPDEQRVIGERIHAIVSDVAPELRPKTWYGMPAWANADNKVVVFFKPAAKFDMRYSELGFNDVAAIDDGLMWPSAYAVTELDAAGAKQVEQLVRKAVG